MESIYETFRVNAGKLVEAGSGFAKGPFCILLLLGAQSMTGVIRPYSESIAAWIKLLGLIISTIYPILTGFSLIWRYPWNKGYDPGMIARHLLMLISVLIPFIVRGSEYALNTPTSSQPPLLIMTVLAVGVLTVLFQRTISPCLSTTIAAHDRANPFSHQEIGPFTHQEIGKTEAYCACICALVLVVSSVMQRIFGLNVLPYAFIICAIAALLVMARNKASPAPIRSNSSLALSATVAAMISLMLAFQSEILPREYVDVTSTKSLKFDNGGRKTETFGA